jgi:NAD(P)-dependent dehydrogenase (short-subunit alcohol dehydrogenase family)
MKRVIVVGASGSLGRAVVKELGARDARVGGTFRNGSVEGGIAARKLDLLAVDTIEPTLADLGEELEGADALVVCASAISASAVERFDHLGDIVPSKLVDMMTVNVAAPILCARAFSKLTGAPPRNIVLVGSIDGAKSVPTAVPYASSKGALMATARGLAKELGPSGVLVNVVAPGLMDAGASRIVPDEVKKEYVKHSSATRFATPAEIARSIAWFALENTYVTAQTIILDGGL